MQDWEAQKVMYGNIDSTEVLSVGWILEFEENMDIKLFGTKAGTWEWINDKTGVRLQFQHQHQHQYLIWISED